MAVIETDIKGGTMHTVNFCIEQNKPLGCLNHPEKFLLNNFKARGNQLLIENKKALPLFSDEDINLFIAKMERMSDISIVNSKSHKLNNKKNDDDERTQQISLF